jgi:selenide,water dikinase
LVVTADFITPVVDDARTWGQIAAANAASDVWAMGGRPLIALNLVAWNAEELGTELLVEVLEGAAEAADQGHWVVAGGHTVDDPEPKFGQAVVGEVHPDRLLTNAGLRPGDHLVLTKAIGTGIVTTAIKEGAAPPGVESATVASMARLNDQAAEQALQAGASGATDVTGFGLLGHLAKMAEASGVDVTLDAAAVPLLPGAGELAVAGHVPGGSRRNLDWVRERLVTPQGGAGPDDLTLVILADAQTSGGLLFGASLEPATTAAAALRSSQHAAAVIGAVTGTGTGRIAVRGRLAPS